METAWSPEGSHNIYYMSWFISIHCKCRQRLILLKCSLSLWVFGGWAAMATLQYCEFRQQNPSLKSLGSSWADLGLIKFGLLICQLLFAHHASKQHCVPDLLVFGRILGGIWVWQKIISPPYGQNISKLVGDLPPTPYRVVQNVTPPDVHVWCGCW